MPQFLWKFFNEIHSVWSLSERILLYLFKLNCVVDLIHGSIPSDMFIWVKIRYISKLWQDKNKISLCIIEENKEFTEFVWDSSCFFLQMFQSSLSFLLVINWILSNNYLVMIIQKYCINKKKAISRSLGGFL